MSVKHGHDEARRYAKLVGAQPDDVLLDLGANYGEVSRLWAWYGARCIAVEPNGDLAAILATIPNTRVITAAVVGDHRDHVTFRSTGSTICAYIDDPNVGTPPARVSTAYDVPAVNFADLVASYRPTVVKVDVEGSEYLFASDFCAMPSHVRAMVIEWHGFGDGSCAKAAAYDGAMIDSGWHRVGPQLRPQFAVSVRGYVH